MFDLKLIPEFPCEIIATDEVGRGPIGGPVVIGAVRIRVNSSESLKGLLKFLRLRGINDSKKLSPEARLKILKKLGVFDLPFRQEGRVSMKDVDVTYCTWDMNHDVIDEMNILAASLEGMRQAAIHLSDAKNEQTIVLIDGHLKLRWGKKASPWTEIPIVKGDSKSLLIGLASIIAKEKRDAFMREMHELYPQYGFASHFGYPTKEHRQAVQDHGPCPIHRKTFKGVREYLRN